MKKQLAFFILLCTCCFASYAQQDSVYAWNKWCASKDSMILFNTANNVIEVHDATIKATDLKLKSLDYTLRIGSPEIKGDTVSVMAMPHAAAGKKMRLAVINKKTDKVIKTITFYSADVPAPVAMIGTIKGNEAAKKDILKQMTLKVFFPNSLYCFPYKVVQYTASIYSAKGGATIPVAGFFLTKEVLEQINNAPPGTVAVFKDIKVTCPECATRTIEDLKLKIK